MGEPEIGDLGLAGVRQEHVVRLEVAVDDQLVVGGVHRPRQRLDQPRRLARRQRPLPQPLPQVAAAAELQGHEQEAVVFADLEDADDIVVL